MKAFIFLAFSVLIHCYIFDFSLSRNSQESLVKRPFLRRVKPGNILSKTGVTKHSRGLGFKEPKLFALKKISALEASKLNYRDGLIHLVQSKVVYPILAQDLELTGTVVLSLDLDKDGKIISYKISEDSEHEILNEAALDVFINVKVYKPLPRLLHPYATFLIPIHFAQ